MGKEDWQQVSNKGVTSVPAEKKWDRENIGDAVGEQVLPGGQESAGGKGTLLGREQ